MVEDKAQQNAEKEPKLPTSVNGDQELDSEDLFEHFNLKTDPGQEPLRIDRFLSNQLGISRNKIQNAAGAGCILVDDKSVKSNFKVRPNSKITVVLPKPPQNFEIKPEEMDLDIIFEDDQLLVLNKDQNTVVHPGVGNYTGTLVHGLLHHFSALPDRSDFSDRPGIVHRLDKNTTGLMVVAKTEHALSHLAKQFFDRTSRRKYQALVWGDFEEDEGRIEMNIGRDKRHRKKMQTFPEGDDGKFAATNYKVLERLGYVTLVECKLETGRTHQIRVHFEQIGHPLFGDTKYGGAQIRKGTIYSKYKAFVENCFKLMPHQALHAAELGFQHPKSAEEMDFNVQAPSHFAELLKKWRTYMKAIG